MSNEINFDELELVIKTRKRVRLVILEQILKTLGLSCNVRDKYAAIMDGGNCIYSSVNYKSCAKYAISYMKRKFKVSPCQKQVTQQLSFFTDNAYMDTFRNSLKDLENKINDIIKPFIDNLPSGIGFQMKNSSSGLIEIIGVVKTDF